MKCPICGQDAYVDHIVNVYCLEVVTYNCPNEGCPMVSFEIDTAKYVEWYQEKRAKVENKTTIDNFCPFCGVESGVLIRGIRAGAKFYVYCPHCKSRTGYHNTRDEAWDAWRDRP